MGGGGNGGVMGFSVRFIVRCVVVCSEGVDMV